LGRISKVVKEPFPYDIDSGNEANSQSEEDMLATFALEPIVAYLNNLGCNDSTKNDGDWVLNENVTYDYSLYFDDVPDSVDTSSLHMPLSTSMMACMQIEDNEGLRHYVFQERPIFDHIQQSLPKDFYIRKL